MPPYARTAAFRRADRKRKCGTRPLGLPSIIRRFFFLPVYRVSHTRPTSSLAVRRFFRRLFLARPLPPPRPSVLSYRVRPTTIIVTKLATRYLFLSLARFFCSAFLFRLLFRAAPRRRRNVNNNYNSPAAAPETAEAAAKRSGTNRRRSGRNEPLRRARKMYARVYGVSRKSTAARFRRARPIILPTRPPNRFRPRAIHRASSFFAAGGRGWGGLENAT